MSSKNDVINYAIIRVGKKFKSFSDIKRFQKHMIREQVTPNANPLLSKENRTLIGSENIVDDIYKYVQNTKIKKNNTLAFELLLTASPEFFLNLSKEKQEEWINDNIKFLWNEFDNDNVVFSVLHQDETSIHIHALIVAKVYDKAKNVYRLNSERYIGGKNALSKLQDSYSESMKKYGLSRGIRGSKASHVDIKDYYALINQTFNSKKLNNTVLSLIEYEAIEPYFKEALKLLKLNGYSDVLKSTLFDFNYSVSARGWYRDFNIIHQKYNTLKLIMKSSNVQDVEFIECIDTMYKMSITKTEEDFNTVMAKSLDYDKIRKRSLDLQRIVQLYDNKNNINEQEIDKLKAKIELLNSDKRILTQTIKTVSQMTKVSQQAIESIMIQVENKICPKQKKSVNDKVDELELDLLTIKNDVNKNK